MRKRSSLLFLLLMASCSLAFSQEEAIYLTNPSFEDMPRHSKEPVGWYDCGGDLFPGESPPDVQPSGEFSVTKPANHGSTYLGMVVRDNDTWESVSQKLSRPLKKGKCYEFSLDLARSELYISLSRANNEQANYITPAKLRIWGGFGYCDKQYLLDETPLVNKHQWMQFNFKFEPIADYSYITLEAFYETPTLFPYNGNILVDNASPIKPIPCDEQVAEEPVSPQPEEPQDIAREDPPRQPASTPKPQKPATATQTTPRAPDPEPEKTIAGVKRSEMAKGQSIRLDKLYFDADSSRIQKESFSFLNEVYEFLDVNNDVVIEIGGHTNGLPPDEYCDKLSTARAKAVADYLASKGISRKRLQYKGYGKRQPVASNKTPYGRRKNQRVEIKILEMGGGDG
ncbi:MAG: OmpA family protein [Lewinellaceae bacterium]|nr:OmpA family protein [Lewinellaceae bacterium]MCB9289550.1 OmpA family protein [Lewinellaceae bacterium]